MVIKVFKVIDSFGIILIWIFNLLMIFVNWMLCFSVLDIVIECLMGVFSNLRENNFLVYDFY